MWNNSKSLYTNNHKSILNILQVADIKQRKVNQVKQCSSAKLQLNQVRTTKEQPVNEQIEILEDTIKFQTLLREQENNGSNS